VSGPARRERAGSRLCRAPAGAVVKGERVAITGGAMLVDPALAGDADERWFDPGTDPDRPVILVSHESRLIDEQYLRTPFFGSRRMTACLTKQGEHVNRKRVGRLMARM